MNTSRRAAWLLTVGTVGLTACDVDPHSETPDTIQAVRWELKELGTDKLIEKGCSADVPVIHASAGEQVKLRVVFESVKRPASVTGDPCSTEDDLSRTPRSSVTAAHCYTDLIAPSPAELISMATVPANAVVEGDEAKASGYDYVLKILGPGTVQQRLSDACQTVSSTSSIVTITGP